MYEVREGWTVAKITLDGCSCALFINDGYAFIYMLYTEPEHRGKGAAKRVIRAIRKWSDRHGIPVGLTVGPFRDMPMNSEKLRKFYYSMGFRKTEGNNMYYNLKAQQ